MWLALENQIFLKLFNYHSSHFWRTEGNACNFLRIDIVLQGATYFVIFTNAELMPPPYRIDNYSEVSFSFDFHVESSMLGFIVKSGLLSKYSFTILLISSKRPLVFGIYLGLGCFFKLTLNLTSFLIMFLTLTSTLSQIFSKFSVCSDCSPVSYHKIN